MKRTKRTLYRSYWSRSNLQFSRNTWNLPRMKSFVITTIAAVILIGLGFLVPAEAQQSNLHPLSGRWHLQEKRKISDPLAFYRSDIPPLPTEWIIKLSDGKLTIDKECTLGGSTTRLNVENVKYNEMELSFSTSEQGYGYDKIYNETEAQYYLKLVNPNRIEGQKRITTLTAGQTHLQFTHDFFIEAIRIRSERQDERQTFPTIDPTSDNEHSLSNSPRSGSAPSKNDDRSRARDCYSNCDEAERNCNKINRFFPSSQGSADCRTERRSCDERCR